MFENITVSLLLVLAGLVTLFHAIWGSMITIPKIGKLPKLSGKVRAISGTLGFILTGFGIGLSLSSPVSAGVEKPMAPLVPQAPVIKSKYSFEDGPMGWLAQDFEGSKAVTQVQYSDEIDAKEGRYTLKMHMDLMGGNAQKGNGEAWVNMLDNPSNGVDIPINLKNRTVTAWVYAPPGSRGDRSKPNGFQLFVKDSDWKSEYGSWQNVVEGQWVQVSLDVSELAPEDGYMDAGFDPHAIIAVGVKMGSGGGSTYDYEGAVYIDAVDW